VIDDEQPVTGRYQGLLGTVIELRTWARTSDDTAGAEAAVIAEIERLQRVFDRFDPSSDLCRWRAGTSVTSPELTEVLDLADRWRRRSGGAFDPTVGRLVAVWNAAASAGRSPTSTELAEAAALVSPTDALTDPVARPWVDLNAIAKGWIVDRALETGLASPGVIGMTVNAGGDIAHRHDRPLIVGIEDPARPFDNVDPLTRVQVIDGAVATSGGARRGWTIDGTRHSHVLDPRTGASVDHITSASVLAPDAATADIVATVLTVLDVADGLAFVDDLDDVGCLLVTADGEAYRDPTWSAAEAELSAP